MAKYPRLVGLNIRNVFSPRSGGWKLEVKASAVLVPPETLNRISQDAEVTQPAGRNNPGHMVSRAP